MEKVTPMVNSHRGKYLTRTSSIGLLESGNSPQFSLVAKFPSTEAAIEFYNSDEYKPFKLARQNGSLSKLLLIPVESGTA